jgi:hypothetical protein
MKSRKNLRPKNSIIIGEGEGEGEGEGGGLEELWLVREEHASVSGGQMVAQLVVVESWKAQDPGGVVR